LRNIDQGKVVFSSWLADRHYSRLKTVDLQGWILPQVLLEEFLTRHASTLRAIRFINCHLVGDQVSLAKWAGKALDLDGIEISLIPGTHVYFLQGQMDGTIEEIPVDTALLPENEPGLPVDRTLLFVSHLLEVCEVKAHRIVFIGGRREGEINARRAKVNYSRLSPKADSAVIRVHKVAVRRTRGLSGLGRRRSGHIG